MANSRCDCRCDSRYCHCPSEYGICQNCKPRSTIRVIVCTLSINTNFSYLIFSLLVHHLLASLFTVSLVLRKTLVLVLYVRSIHNHSSRKKKINIDISFIHTATVSLLVSTVVNSVVKINPSITPSEVAVTLGLFAGIISIIISLLRLGMLVDFIPGMI